MSAYMTSIDIATKTQGLKGYKQAQKDNQHAKRASAVDQAMMYNTTDTTGFVVTNEVASVQDKVESALKNKDAISKVSVEQNQETSFNGHNIIATTAPEYRIPTITITAPSAMVDNNESLSKQNSPKMEKYPVKAVSGYAFDMVAYRKALEAALYANMDTPREMLIRCKYMISNDTEFHNMNEDNFSKGTESAESGPRAVCLDDNGFEIIPPAIRPNEQGEASSYGKWLPISIDELFARASESTAHEDGPVKILETYEQEDSKAEAHQWVPISIKQILVGILTDEEDAASKPQNTMKLSAGSRSLESVEYEMRKYVQCTSAQSIPSSVPHLDDPAIISHKIQQPALGETGVVNINSTCPTSKQDEDANHFNNLISSMISSASRRGSSSTSSHYSGTSSVVDPHGRSYTPPTPYWTFPLLYYGDDTCYKASYLANWGYPTYGFPGYTSYHNPNMAIVLGV